MLKKLRARFDALDTLAEVNVADERAAQDPFNDVDVGVELDEVTKQRLLRFAQDKAAQLDDSDPEAKNLVDQLHALTGSVEKEPPPSSATTPDETTTTTTTATTTADTAPSTTQVAPNHVTRIEELQAENERLLQRIGLKERPWGPPPQLPSLEERQSLLPEEDNTADEDAETAVPLESASVFVPPASSSSSSSQEDDERGAQVEEEEEEAKDEDATAAS